MKNIKEFLKSLVTAEKSLKSSESFSDDKVDMFSPYTQSALVRINEIIKLNSKFGAKHADIHYEIESAASKYDRKIGRCSLEVSMSISKNMEDIAVKSLEERGYMVIKSTQHYGGNSIRVYWDADQFDLILKSVADSRFSCILYATEREITTC